MELVINIKKVNVRVCLVNVLIHLLKKLPERPTD